MVLVLSLCTISSHTTTPLSNRWESDYPEKWQELMDMCDAAATRKVIPFTDLVYQSICLLMLMGGHPISTN